MQEQQANPEQQSPPAASPQPSKHDLLETALVEMIVVLRDAFLRSCNGRPPMSYWDQIQTRVRGAARTSATAAEWITAAQKGLRIGAPSSSDCLVINRLVAICDEYGMDLEAMEFIEREIGFLLSSAREIVDARKAAREAAGVSFGREEIVAAAEANGLSVEC